MPRVTGMELYRQLSEARSPLIRHFIVATGDHVSPEAAAFLADSRLPVIEKPYQLETLLELIGVHAAAPLRPRPVSAAAIAT